MKIKKVYSTDKDKKHIAGLGWPQVPENKAPSFAGFIVNKPWGREYVLLSSDVSEVWSLFIARDEATSVHCHPNKKTALIVIEGKARFSTLHESFELGPLDSVVIDRGVFHEVRALSPQGVYIIEVETPPAKYDLLRLQDHYGREKTAYEGIDRLSASGEIPQRFREGKKSFLAVPEYENVCAFVVKTILGVYREDDLADLRVHDLVVILDGKVLNGAEQYGVGDVISSQNFLEHIARHRIENLSLLLIRHK